MAIRRPTVVGAFSDAALAERAMDALKEAGFSNDDIRSSVAMTGGSFFDNLKSWLAGEEPDAKDDVAHYLKQVGLPESEATAYAREYAAGHPLVAVRAPGREEEARAVLRRSGSFQMTAASAGEAFAQQQTPDDEEPAEQAYAQGIAQPSGQVSGYEPPVPHPPPAGTGVPERDLGTTSEQAEAIRLRQEQQRAQKQHTVTGTSMPERDRDTTGEQVEAVPLRQEQLHAEKQRVQKGEVQVHKEVVEEQQSIEVPTRREEVVVERRPLDEPRPADTPVGQDEVIRVPVSEEQVRVIKQPVETGEVEVKKRQVEEPKRVTETTRREEAHIEPTGDIPIDEKRGEQERRP